jgi:lipopolysaccharide transport system ATP-binding protein
MVDAIEVQNLGKRYIIQGQRLKRRRTFSEDLLGTLKSLTGTSPARPEIIWALKDVSFSVARGQAVGIIGSNGSGKSTLLKILSRVSDPTEGKAVIRGRLGALLEVGVGINPELTGRENIYLLGTILGLRKSEIDSRFDAIVQFADIERFLNLPVKRYSSGMQLRLGFGVASHLDPDILLVDEALAVGDIAFQNRCMAWMKTAVKQGAAVVFVSHQLDLVRQFCDRCLVLNQGRVTVCEDPETAIDLYSKNLGLPEETASFTADEDPTLPMQITKVDVLDKDRVSRKSFEFFDEIAVQIEYVVRQELSDAYIELVLHSNGEPFFCSWDIDTQPRRLSSRAPGRYVDTISLPSPMFKAGHYTISFNIYDRKEHKIYQRLENIVGIEIVLLSRDHQLVSFGRGRGRVSVPLDWVSNTR